MITGFSVHGFKSLAKFSLDGISNFTCLVGLNGSGKSSVLQAIDFASHLFRGDVANWLSKRAWSISDLHSKYSAHSNILVAFTFLLDNGKYYNWVAGFNRTTLTCSTESVSEYPGGRSIFQLGRGKYTICDSSPVKVDFNYAGSILSALKDDVLGPELVGIRDLMLSISSLELLSPHLMRYSLRDAATDIGVGGEKLSPYLYGIKGERRESLVRLLRNFYPSVVDFKVKQERAGWKKLHIIEEFNGDLIETEAKHVNDGLLRILAILAQADSGKSLLLFDEVENGVNPEIVERLVEVLQNSGRQILVTTHSPMILNYLSDDVAKDSVHFIYRSFDGGTRQKLLFDIPKMKSKLEFMGPGEAFVDTSLSGLAKECASYDESRDEIKLEGKS
ncbi:AAA family ATPase [Pseudomonas farsensis]|uniref:AAA family ATPase n=1 Tax=Pseudomonas farsensis TaxID=2745492 RepID=A0ABU8QLX6_9PSED